MSYDTQPGRTRIGIDIDETIIWFLPGFLYWYNGRRGTQFKVEDFKSYRWWETLGISKDLAYVVADRYSRELGKDYEAPFDGRYPGDFMEFVEGAQDSVEDLGIDYELHAITDRSPLLEAETFELSAMLYSEEAEDLFREGLVLPMHQIHHTRELGGSKSIICQRLGIKTIVDDNADVAVDCAAKGIKVVMPDRPWNRQLRTGGLIRRVYDWEGVKRVLSKGKF